MASPRGEPDSTPICRCRVLYLGSAVPHVTKDGLQGIQEPLRELYPEQGALGARGIDSWLSVWSNGLLLENVDENHKKVTRFFPIDTLHYCAAVRYVLVPEKTSSGSSQPATPRFLPLDSPFARSPNPSHPPLFAAILRRTTGIKVLECHAFICKREMAANALVRCCFHAYADSSYARHIDGGSTSVYGTLRSQNAGSQPIFTTSSIEKVEGWRRMSPSGGPTTSGSTLTLNSQIQPGPSTQNQNGTLTSNATTTVSAGDDISIYNGDENHKVWAGSSTGPVADREEIYGNYSGSTMRSGRSGRPRQMVTPVTSPPPPPPPPPTKEESKNKKANKERARRKKMMGGSREDLYPLMNGSLMRGSTAHPMVNGGGMRSSSSLSGTLMKGGTMPYQHPYANSTILRPSSAHPIPINGYHPHPAPILVVQHPTTTLPHPRHMKKAAGTFSHRPIKPGIVIPGRPIIQAPVIPLGLHQGPIMPVVASIPPASGKKSKHHHYPPVAIEEPIYMPSARPLSPVASFQPGHFPHEAYLMQQYANTTMDSKHKKKLSKSEGKSGSKKGGPVVNGDGGDSSPPPPMIVVEESPFNTGIYRKKGHLNERAFSYSIRQEHRSRSYGSLANLKFATPIPNGGGPPETANKEDMKKEREIMQMMHDLELSGDELERSEVPAAVYESRRAAAAAAVSGSRR